MANNADMTLSDYLAENQLTAAAFAARVGVPASTITRLAKGERIPRLGTIRRILRATEGAVTADDFAPEPTPEAVAS